MSIDYFNKMNNIIDENFSRRKFLKFQMKGLLFLAAGSSGLILSKKSIAEPVPDIDPFNAARASSSNPRPA